MPSSFRNGFFERGALEFSGLQLLRYKRLDFGFRNGANFHKTKPDILSAISDDKDLSGNFARAVTTLQTGERKHEGSE
jgi:hypothetical protein